VSLINTDVIWRSLGDFFDLFPYDERVYWETFWEAYSDIIADLWGMAFQVDRAKSLFDTTATFERREVLIKLGNLSQDKIGRLRVGRVYQTSDGTWIVRGYVPRDLRNFRSSDVDDRGLIRLGTEVLEYLSANVETTGDNLVRDATFVLGDAPTNAYGDDPEFDDDFVVDKLTLSLRIDHPSGSTIIDAVGSGDVNDSGVLVLGTEILEYESVTMLADRYQFQLATSHQSPATSATSLTGNYSQDTEIVVYRHDPDRWKQERTGQTRITSASGAKFIVDDLPSALPASARLRGQYQIRENSNFDLSVGLVLNNWTDPTGVGTGKFAGAEIEIGGLVYELGIETRRTALGVEHVVKSGGQEAELASASNLEVRFKRLGSRLEFLYRLDGEDDFLVLRTLTVPGTRVSMNLLVDDPNSDSASIVTFDSVTRRDGVMAGQERLEEFFAVSSYYPHAYDIDSAVTGARELRSAPRNLSQEMQTSRALTDAESREVWLRVIDAEDFRGVEDVGLVTIGDVTAVYETVERVGDEYLLTLQKKLDPGILPLDSGTNVTLSTLVLTENIDYRFTGTSGIEFRDIPPVLVLWAPVADVDYRHVQNTFGRLVDLDAETSNQKYLNRVQGTWKALMGGASIGNVESGLQLAMGLPAAKTAGVVTGIEDTRDRLGRLIERRLTILGERGAFEHYLDPDLYPFVDWEVILGQKVERFEPLTNGVEVLDVFRDPLWHQKFPGVSDIERFNTFGIFVDVEALTADADISDAIRFGLRVKPTYTKMALRFRLTSGNEDLSQELDDSVSAILIPKICEDMEFDEGEAPDPIDEALRLGDGHKLGQGKTLGGSGQWHYARLGTYARQGPYPGGSYVDGTSIFEADGAYMEAVGTFTNDGSAASGTNIFKTAGAHVFTSGDVGRRIDVSGLGSFLVTGVIDPSNVYVNHVFLSDLTSATWTLRQGIFHESDLGKNIFIADGTINEGEHKISGGLGFGDSTGITSANQVKVIYTFAGSATGVDWEMRDYHQLGQGHPLAEITAYRCPVPSTHVPSEVLDVEQIVTVAVE